MALLKFKSGLAANLVNKAIEDKEKLKNLKVSNNDLKNLIIDLLDAHKLDKQELKLVITDFISVNHYLAYRTVMKNGKPMAMSYKTKEAKNYIK